MNIELLCILDRFPEMKDLIVSQYENDEEFQALCLDYFLCLRSLNNSEIDIQKYKQHRAQYTELKRMLEDKMLQHIRTEK